MVLFTLILSSGLPSFAQNELPVDTAKDTELSEFVVSTKRAKYSRKNNPAYDLMTRVRANKEKTDPRREPNYSYDTYEKITLGINDFRITDDSGKYGFMKDYYDTAANTGRDVLLVSVREKVQADLYSGSPGSHKRVVTARRSEGIDKAFDQKNVTMMLEDALREVDVYSNDITLMQNRFVSPLGVLADDYYRYRIVDTVASAEGPLIELEFTPQNPQSFSFNGKLFIAKNDSVEYVRRLDMRVPRVINLNYVDNVFISQEFMLDSLGKRHKTLDDMTLELQVIAGTPSFYGRRLTTHSGFSYAPHPVIGDYLSKIGFDFDISVPDGLPADYWSSVRLIPLTKAEGNLGALLPRLRQNKLFFWTEKILMILVQGYWRPTPDWPLAFGPVNTLVSYNKAEGVRLRVGAMTYASLSPHWFIRGYGAYGFRDRKWKYMADLEYSFIPKKEHSREFPINGFRLSYKYDIDQLGQRYLFTNPDNVFLSLKRKDSYLVTYQRQAKLEYRLELLNNFSVAVGVQHQKQEATCWVPFVYPDGSSDRSYYQSNAYVELRWAPGEKFVQGASMRLPVNMDAPVFLLSHEFGPKNFLGSKFTLNRTEFSVSNRFWFSSFGYLDAILKGGKLWNKVQFPALLWQNANLTYTIQPESYSLMNPMEFAFDYYGSLDLTYWGNGILFNRIPFVNKAKLREVVGFKMLMGGLTKKNNPAFNKDLYDFPLDSHTSVLTDKPYMEISAGIDNILTILRVDYVWRLSYRNRPDIDRSGVRISLHFTF